MRSTKSPPRRRDPSQQYSAVRAPPICRKPVGLGAKRVRTVMGSIQQAWSEALDFSRYRDPNPRLLQRIRRSKRFLVVLTRGWLISMPALADDTPSYDRPGYGFTPVVLGAGDITLEQGLGDW